MKLGRFELNDVYLEDSYKAIKEIPDKSVDLIYTDIPYLVGHGGSSVNPSSVEKRITRLIDEDLSGITDGINYEILDEFVRIQPYIYIYMVQ